MPPVWGIGQSGHFYLLIGLKNTNLEEDVEILLPVNFHWIPFSGFRGKVENASANQRPGRSSCFSDRPEKYKLGRGRWYLASCLVSLNSVQRFHKRSRKCLSQSEAMAAILFFRSARKTQIGRGRWDLASCQVSLNSVKRFQRRSKKCFSQSDARAAILIFQSTPPPKKKPLTSQRPLPSLFFFRDDRNTKMAARPLIGWDFFDFSSETIEQKLRKLDRKQDLNVLCQGFFPIGKPRWPPGLWLAGTFSTSSLKPLNAIQRNLTGSRISTTSAKFCFSGRLENQDANPNLWLAETF